MKHVWQLHQPLYYIGSWHWPTVFWICPCETSQQTMTSEERTVNHFHFTTWADHGVLPGTNVLIQFTDLVRYHIDKEGDGAPTVVHCRYRMHASVFLEKVCWTLWSDIHWNTNSSSVSCCCCCCCKMSLRFLRVSGGRFLCEIDSHMESISTIS